MFIRFWAVGIGITVIGIRCLLGLDPVRCRMLLLLGLNDVGFASLYLSCFSFCRWSLGWCRLNTPFKPLKYISLVGLRNNFLEIWNFNWYKYRSEYSFNHFLHSIVWLSSSFCRCIEKANKDNYPTTLVSLPRGWVRRVLMVPASVAQEWQAWVESLLPWFP